MQVKGFNDSFTLTVDLSHINCSYNSPSQYFRPSERLYKNSSLLIHFPKTLTLEKRHHHNFLLSAFAKYQHRMPKNIMGIDFH